MFHISIINRNKLILILVNSSNIHFRSIITLDRLESSKYITVKANIMGKQKQNNKLRKALNKAKMPNRRKNLTEEDSQVQKEKDRIHHKVHRTRLSIDERQVQKKRSNT